MPETTDPEGFRFCKKCNSTKPLEDFPKSKNEKFGRAYSCKPCFNKTSRENHTKRVSRGEGYREKLNSKRRLTLQERKKIAVDYKGGVCSDCGGKFLPCVYDFHHLNPKEKDYDPSAAAALSMQTMYEELEKCILLCANCHRIRHYNDKTCFN